MEQGYNLDLFVQEARHLIESRKLLREMQEEPLGEGDIVYRCPINVQRIIRTNISNLT